MWLYGKHRTGTNKVYYIYTAELPEAEAFDVDRIDLIAFETIFYNPHYDQKIMSGGGWGKWTSDGN